MVLFLSILVIIGIAYGDIRVVATYPYIGDLVRKIAGEKAEVFVLAKGTEDPHFVVPRPSFIAKLRRADLLIINGAYLEAGFLPPLLERVGNPEIQPGSKGFLDLSQFIELIEKPERLSRAMGDIHPEGNPHFYLNPKNVLIIAEAIKEKICELDRENCGYYQRRFEDFQGKWKEKMRIWGERMARFRGIKVVSYHSVFNYFLIFYGLSLVGTLEPKPGIPPNPGHINKLIKGSKNVMFVLQDVYHERKTASRFAQITGAKLLVLPHDVGSLRGVEDIYSLFETIIRRFEGD